MSRQKSSDRFRFSAASVLLAGLVLLLTAFRGEEYKSLYLMAAVIPCVMFLSETMFARMFSLDRMVMALVLWLLAAGIAAVAPAGSENAWSQSLACGAALIALLIGGIVIRSLSPSWLTVSCTAFLGLLFLAAGCFPGTQSLPLAQAAHALLLIAFASLFARQGPVSALLLGAAALALTLLGGGVEESVIWGVVILLLLFAADGRMVVVLPALALVLVLFFGAYFLYSGSVSSPESSPLSALVSAGWIGADTLPEAIAGLKTDSLFPRLAGHYGLIFAGLTALLFLPLSLRGSSVAVSARSRFHAVLAMGATLLLALRALAAVLSAFGFLPFSGLTLPFLTSSVSDLCAQLFLAGLLCGISGRNDADLAEDAHLAMLAK